jgi:hypothetical protein
LPLLGKVLAMRRGETREKTSVVGRTKQSVALGTEEDSLAELDPILAGRVLSQRRKPRRLSATHVACFVSFDVCYRVCQVERHRLESAAVRDVTLRFVHAGHRVTRSASKPAHCQYTRRVGSRTTQFAHTALFSSLLSVISAVRGSSVGDGSVFGVILLIAGFGSLAVDGGALFRID